MLPPYDFSIHQIDRATTDTLKEGLNVIALKGRDTCELEITCRDGEVIDGLKMIQVIKDGPVVANGTMVGDTGSMAAVILQCCRKRRMMSNATLHCHYGHWRVSFLAYFDNAMAARNRQAGIAHQQALIEPISKRLGISDEEVHKLLREDKQMDAEEALARGLIDRIVYPPEAARRKRLEELGNMLAGVVQKEAFVKRGGKPN